MSGQHNWGPVEKPMGRNNERTIGAADGEVTQRTPKNQSAGPHHDVHYDATDSRHGHEKDMMGWPSIDHNSGPVTEHDWANSTGHFPDGPGAWRQT